MKTKKVNIRIGNVELRNYKGWSVPKNEGDASDKYEFVKWDRNSDNTEYCYVLAFAEKSGDGYDIRSVGMRPWELDEQDFKDYNDLVGIFFHLDLVKKFF